MSGAIWHVGKALAEVMAVGALLSLHLFGQTHGLGGKPGRSAVRAQHGMVASSQPLASQVGLDVLKRGGNAVDAAMAMAAVLNVTEPMMTGVGGDAFMLVYWAKTGEIQGLNASGRAPKSLTLDYFQKRGIKQMPVRGWETVTVPGAFDGWVTLLDRYGTMKLADLLQPAINYAENGFPVMEKAAEDWAADADALKPDPAANSTYLPEGRAARAGEIFRNPHLAHTLRVLAQGGRDAFYTGEIGRAIVDYAQKHGGFLTADDLAAQHSEWVEPISTTYRGYTVYECPPNGQGLTALLALNVLEGFDVKAMRSDPAQYYHTLIEATKIAFVDRNRYIADPKFVNVPVTQLLDKNYAAQRRQLLNPNTAIEPPAPGLPLRQGETTYFTVVDKDRNAVSFINSLYEHWGSGIVAGDTGIVLQDRGSAFSLDPQSPNVIAPGKRPFHTIIPAMVSKDGKLFMSFGVMGGAMQAQGHVQVLTNMIDLGMDVQQAIETPRFRYDGDKRVILEPEMGENVISALEAKGHERIYSDRNVRTYMGGAQAIVVDWQHNALEGGSDPRKDGMALGW